MLLDRLEVIYQRKKRRMTGENAMLVDIGQGAAQHSSHGAGQDAGQGAGHCSGQGPGQGSA